MSVSERPATRLWREALAQLDQLLQQSPAEQQRCLTDIAQSQPQLHSVLVSLLEAEARAESSGFLDPPSSRASVSLQPGAQLGPYRIDSQIGSGGMGEVWLARRVDGLYEGDVAIKTLHPYFGGGALRERFLREAQILGRLTHPNIARLLDAGVAPDGSVYLVLEYVRGVSVDTWCDERRLGIEARLRLFLEVCAAVAQAHANLVVHRDIKPSNILVTGEGDVKLLDFGVAKLVEGETGIERTELTRMTGRIFTPEYAAPEQVMGETITTATDVYALGVLLHVLLTATRPYGKSDNTIEIERAVLHDEPVRPSRAVDSDGAAEIAERRSTTPARLQRSLAGDLDNIIGRALRKAPADRYASVLEFADDVRRHLEHKPIRAQAEPLIARARKFVRRHRVGAAASALIVLVVAAGIAGVLWQSHVAREQAVIAAQEAQKAAAVRDFLLDIFNSNSESHPDGARARQTTAEELLDIASRNILGSVDQDPGVRLELMGTMGRLNLILEKYEQTEALQRERVRFATERLGPSDTRTLEAMLDLGVFLRQRGSYDEARASVESAIRIMEDIGDRSSLLRGRAQSCLAQIVYMQSDVKDPTPIGYYRTALEILERLEPSDALVDATLGLGRSYELAGQYLDAISTNERAIQLAASVGGPHSTAVGGGHQQLARSLARVFRLAEAEQHLAQAIEVFRFSVGPENGFTTMARLDVGRMMNLRGRQKDAVAELEEVLAIRIRVDGAGNYWVQETRSALAEALLATGNLDRAQLLVDEALTASASKPKQNIRTLLLRTRAAVARQQHRMQDALNDVEAAEQINEGIQGPGSLRAATLLAARGETLLGLGRVDEAVAVLGEARKLLTRTETDPHRPEQMNVRIAMAMAQSAAGQRETARQQIMSVLDELGALPGREELWLLEEHAQQELAAVLFAQGKTDPACNALDAAMALRQSRSLADDARLTKMAAQRSSKGCRSMRVI